MRGANRTTCQGREAVAATVDHQPRSPGATHMKTHITLVHDVDEDYVRPAWLNEGTGVPEGWRYT